MNLRKLICRVLVLLIPSLIFGKEVLAQNRDYYGWGMGPGMMGWGIGGWFGPLFMLIFWVLIIVLIILLIRWLLSSSHTTSQSTVKEVSALEILKKRYARGEINKDEFEAKKKDLS